MAGSPECAEISTANTSPNPRPAQSTVEVDGGYGWVCVACMFLITANTWGLNGAFGVYLQYYLSNDIFPHSADFAVAFIGGLTIGLILLAAPVVSLSSAKLGTRATLGIGTVLETAALVAASFSYRFWHLYLTQGVLYGCGAGLLWLGASPIIPQWFTKRRGFANSLALAGSGAGGLVYSLVVEKILAELGLAWSFRITACSTFTGNAICTALIRDRNKTIKPVHSPFNANLCRNTRFLSIQAWMLLSVMGYTIIMFSVPPYARRVGLSSQQASVAGAVVNAGMMFGRPFVGYYSDTLGRTNIVTAGTALCGLFCIAIWIPVTNYAGILAFSFLAGCLCGTCWVCLPPLLADSLGLRVLPSALSLTWLVLVIPGAVAEPIALGLRTTTTRPYLAVEILSGLMFLTASACILVLRRAKCRQMQKGWWSVV